MHIKQGLCFFLAAARGLAILDNSDTSLLLICRLSAKYGFKVLEPHVYRRQGRECLGART